MAYNRFANALWFYIGFPSPCSNILIKKLDCTWPRNSPAHKRLVNCLLALISYRKSEYQRHINLLVTFPKMLFFQIKFIKSQNKSQHSCEQLTISSFKLLRKVLVFRVISDFFSIHPSIQMLPIS